MHDTLGSPQATGYEWLTAVTGSLPDVWSGDFGYAESQTSWTDDIRKRNAQEAKMLSLGGQGVILTLSWHMCNPTIGEPCSFKEGVQRPLAEDEWADLLTPGSPLHQRWLTQLKPLMDLLKSLESRHITVMLRPLHEANIPGMWWHGTPTQSVQLWRMLQRHLIVENKLHNLVFVWSVAYHPRYWKEARAWYPGDEFVDILGVDIYPPRKGETPAFEEAWKGLKAISAAKPLALTEVSRLPNDTELQARPWAWVLPWGRNMLEAANTHEEILRF